MSDLYRLLLQSEIGELSYGLKDTDPGNPIQPTNWQQLERLSGFISASMQGSQWKIIYIVIGIRLLLD